MNPVNSVNSVYSVNSVNSVNPVNSVNIVKSETTAIMRTEVCSLVVMAAVAAGQLQVQDPRWVERGGHPLVTSIEMLLKT